VSEKCNFQSSRRLELFKGWKAATSEKTGGGGTITRKKRNGHDQYRGCMWEANCKELLNCTPSHMDPNEDEWWCHVNDRGGFLILSRRFVGLLPGQSTHIRTGLSLEKVE
jgi:hypothetical protein